MKITDYTTTLGQKEVYCLLINHDNPRFPRTQSEVCAMLEISKSTCSDRVKKLLDLEFITELDRTESGVHYRRGKKHEIIERQIEAEIRGSGVLFDAHGHAIRSSSPSEPYRPLFRLHLNGGWIKFSVAAEGILDTIKKDPDHPNQALFGDAESYRTKGAVNWNAKIYFNDVWLAIRYQRTRNGKKFFYIQPGSMIIEADEVTPDNDVVTPFLRQCRPLLQYLEKYGEWKFKRAPDGDFLVEASVRQGSVGTKEYGLDEFVTGLITDVAGDIGIPQTSNIWTDKSPSAMGPNGEAEFNKASYARAIENLPVIHALSERSVTELQLIREDNIRRELNLEKRHNLILKLLEDQQQEIEHIYGITNNGKEAGT